MQTFLPHSTFEESAKVLDYRRLGNQRNECMVILKVLKQGQYCMYDLNEKKYLYGKAVTQAEGYKIRETPWYNHTATRMWSSYPEALAKYGLEICKEWIRRGYKDTCTEKIKVYAGLCPIYTKPLWLGDERLHASHRAALLEKNYDWYKKYDWKELPKIEYYWPI